MQTSGYDGAQFGPVGGGGGGGGPVTVVVAEAVLLAAFASGVGELMVALLMSCPTPSGVTVMVMVPV